ncbi:MAG: hypothetical protein V4625_03905 [Pseudomonadota bacterium]
MLALVKRAVTGQTAASGEASTAGLSSREEVQKQLLGVLGDCPDGVVKIRINGRIAAAASVLDLWHLRSDIYQLVAREKGQTEASRRINSLLPLFEGWVPLGQRVPV